MVAILTAAEKEHIIEYCCKTNCTNCIFYGCQDCYDSLRFMVELIPGYYMLTMNTRERGSE